MSGNTAAPYDNANKPTVALQNPLALYQQYVGVQNALNESKAFRSRQVGGQAMLDASGPNGVDPAAVTANLRAAGPDAALAAPQALANTQSLAQAQQGFNVQQQQRLTGQLGSLLSQGDDQQTRANYAAMAQQELDAGTINKQHFDNAMANMPPDGSPPSAFRNFGTRALVGTLAGPEMASVLLPTKKTTTGVGGRIVGYTQGPALPAQGGGAVSMPPQTGAQMGTSPAEKLSPVTGPAGPNNEPSTIPAADYARLHGLDPDTGNALPNPAFAGIPSALRKPNPPPPPVTPTYTSQGPAAVAAQTETGATGGKGFADISTDAVASRGRASILGNMLADTSQFTTGPLAGIKEKVRALGTQIAIPVDTEKLSASESFNKLAAGLASQQANAGSDARLNVAQAANPHAELSPQGVDLMLRQLRGNEDYLQARAQLAAAWPNKQDKQGFEAKVGKTLNPQVFQYNRMTPDQKRTWFNALSGKDRTQFKTDFNGAQNMPGGLPGG